ncbi:MAG: hypothetical protein P4L22_01520 [Candidatus Babeliales bacterium]|nr:hypothetical protein [Candidatus Babeliales bacterium]
MKFFSLLLVTAIIFQSAYGVSGLPITGKTSWEHLINRHACHANILRTRYSENSAKILLSNLDEIERNIILLEPHSSTDRTLDRAFENDRGALIYLYKQIYLPGNQLSLQAKKLFRLTYKELLSLKEEALEKVKMEKIAWTNYLNNHPDKPNKTLKIAKYAGVAALIATAIYALRNKETLKEQASEFASKVTTSDFASNVIEVGNNISTSIAGLKAYQLAANSLQSIKDSASQHWDNASKSIINSQIYQIGSENLSKATQKVSDVIAIQIIDTDNFAI